MVVTCTNLGHEACQPSDQAWCEVQFPPNGKILLRLLVAGKTVLVEVKVIESHRKDLKQGLILACRYVNQRGWHITDDRVNDRETNGQVKGSNASHPLVLQYQDVQRKLEMRRAELCRSHPVKAQRPTIIKQQLKMIGRALRSGKLLLRRLNRQPPLQNIDDIQV